MLLTEPEPPRGVALPVAPGIHRLVADNPGAMTYHGTNTYLIDTPDGVVVLDPGPNAPTHTAGILAATGGNLAKILLTHTHRDHLDGVPALAAATGAPTCGYRHSAAPDFTPDIPIDDGAEIAGLTAIFTPGHAADHLCYAMPSGSLSAGVLFSGDHVMGWSTSTIGPPGGNMIDYFASLNRLLARNDPVYLPGHGPPLPDPLPYVRDLLAHRVAREQAILAALQPGPASARALMESIYAKLSPALQMAAERSVAAHLAKLEAESRVVREGAIYRVI